MPYPVHFMDHRWAARILCAIIILSAAPILAACAQAQAASTPGGSSREILLCGWGNDLPDTVLQAFEAQSGYHVSIDIYPSQEDAITQLEAKKPCDLVVMDNEMIPGLVAKGLAAELDLDHIPNFKNLSPDFRDLAIDPGNRHTIPLTWGTTGLVVRTDQVQAPVTRWSDLWKKEFSGRILLWPLPRYVIGFTLLSLGYSVNSENPDELAAASARLEELAPAVYFGGEQQVSSADDLVAGKALISMGWLVDVETARQQIESIDYVIPQEGAILWGDNLIIPAYSPNKAVAEQLMNFILQPEMGAEITNQTLYAVPNDAARKLFKPEILNDVVITAPEQASQHFDIIMPLSPEGEKLYATVWETFEAAVRSR